MLSWGKEGTQLESTEGYGEYLLPMVYGTTLIKTERVIFQHEES